MERIIERTQTHPKICPFCSGKVYEYVDQDDFLMYRTLIICEGCKKYYERGEFKRMEEW